MSLDDFEADVSLVRQQFESSSATQPSSISISQLLEASKPTQPSTAAVDVSPSPRPSDALSPTSSASKLKTLANSTTKVGNFFKKYIGGDRKKPGTSKDDNDASPKLTSSPGSSSPSLPGVDRSSTSPPSSTTLSGPQPSPASMPASAFSISSSTEASRALSNPALNHSGLSSSPHDGDSAPPSMTWKQERRREQSRSWGSPASSSSEYNKEVSTYFQQQASRASATLVTITIDPTDVDRTDVGRSSLSSSGGIPSSSSSPPTSSSSSSSNVASASSSARSSSHSQPATNLSDIHSSGADVNHTSESSSSSISPRTVATITTTTSSSSTRGATADFGSTYTGSLVGDSTYFGASTIATIPSTASSSSLFSTLFDFPSKSPAGSAAAAATTPINASPSTTSNSASASSTTSSEHVRRATVADYSANPIGNSAAATNNSRARRRAAVFQKASSRFDEPQSGGTSPSQALDEQLINEEASVSIWEESKEDHIIFEKPSTASPSNTASPNSPSTPVLTSTASSSQLSPAGVASSNLGMRETVVFGESDSPSPSSSSTPSLSTTLASAAKPEVVAGTLNQLIKYLTSSKGVDGRALHTFLLTYTSFTTPKVLLEKLIQRYDIPKHKMEPKAPKNESDVVKSAKDIEAACRQKHLRVVNFVRKWLDMCFVDLTEEVIEMVFQFTEKLRSDGATSLATLIDNALSSKLAGLAKRKMTQFELPPPVPIIPKPKMMMMIGGGVSSATSSPAPAAAAPLEFMDVDPIELARQITLIDYELFGQIRAMELLNQSWNKPKLKHRSPHVLEMIQRFNTLSKWLCGVILNTESLKERIKVMQNVVKLGRALLQLKNFNALNAVLSALQNSAVYRLTQTKEGMGSKYLKLIEEWAALMAPRQNSANYKAALAAAQAPAVPYLGYYLSALTFIEEGNPQRLHGLINFKKCRLISKVIVGLLQYQVGKRYNLVPIDSVKELITNLAPTETDDELYEISLLREPRVTQAQ